MRHVLLGDSCRNGVHRDRNLDVLLTVEVAVVANSYGVIGLHVRFQHLHHPVARFSGLVDEVDAGAFPNALEITTVGWTLLVKRHITGA